MDNINQTGNRSVNFAFTQSIGNYSADQLNSMDISDLMTLVMTRMLDAKEVQFKQKLEEADARTKRLEGFGNQMKSLARIKAEFGADDKDDTAIKDSKGAKEKVSSGQWDESAADYQVSSSSSSKTGGAYRPYSELGFDGQNNVWSRVEDTLENTLTDDEKAYLRAHWANSNTTGNYESKETGGDPVMDQKIRAKFEQAWHKEGYEPPKNIRKEDASRIFAYNETGGNYKAEQMMRAYFDYNLSASTGDYQYNNINYTSDSSTWKAALSDEGRQFMDNVDTFCEAGLANGTLTDADVKNIKSGDFKKSDIEALEVSIKNEQDKINSINTRDQIDIQKITNQIDQLNNLISTLTKKFNEASTSVINRM